jgi:tetratricopeptide (TPR) repeat protein
VAPLEELPPIDIAQATAAVKGAIERELAAVRADPKSGKAWGKLGLALRAHDFAVAANQCLAVARRLEPREFLWPYIHGVSLTVSDPERAIACFRQAALLRPSDGLPHYRLGELLLQQGQAQAAAREFEQALSLEPDSARGRLGLARCALLDGDLAESRLLAAEASRLATGQRPPHELLVQVCHRLGDEKAAESELQILAGLPAGEETWDDPHVARILEMRRDPAWIASSAQKLLAEGRGADAVGLLEEVVASDEADPNWKVLLSRALISTGDYRRASAVVAAGIARHPTSADLRYQLGVLAFLKQDWRNAAEAFQQAIKLKPDSGQAWYNLGHALGKLEDTESAVSAFRNAVRVQPDLAAAHANLGELLVKSGTRAEGLVHLRLAVKLDPADNWARERLEQAEPP